MKITTEEKTIVIKNIALETLLERAILLAMVNVAESVGNSFDENVKIAMDVISGKENLYPSTQEVTRILSIIRRLG